MSWRFVANRFASSGASEHGGVHHGGGTILTMPCSSPSGRSDSMKRIGSAHCSVVARTVGASGVCARSCES